ncbi:MAG: leucyl aminopeptidase family protein, partial [Nanoarchaeota archaeon]|nr:leucyl aminopeptidase family protein [Nanoarchaeota archaeon]
KKEIIKMGMGGLLAVSKGSVQEPKFIILDYKGKDEKPVILVGKGVTFDAGGLDVKPAKYMEDMRCDMGGAATVIQTIKTAQDLNLKRHVIAIVPTCENLLGGDAFKQGDIIKSYNGKTIEVLHTDAEGRLILADGLGYADKNYKAEVIIDIATLTGASIHALGYEIAALMSYDDKLKKDLIEASKKSDEYLWELPMIEEYKGLVKSDIGDVRNMAKESPGPGTITAGIFLSNFVKQKWAHIDIGAAGWSPYDRDYKKRGGTGHGLRTFISFLEK